MDGGPVEGVQVEADGVAAGFRPQFGGFQAFLVDLVGAGAVGGRGEDLKEPAALLEGLWTNAFDEEQLGPVAEWSSSP